MSKVHRTSSGVVLPDITYIFGVPPEIAEQLMSIYSGEIIDQWIDANGNNSYSLICTESELDQLSVLKTWIF